MKIDKREKRILIAIGAFIVFLLYYLFVLSPAFSKINAVTKLVVKNESQLSEMVKLKSIHDRYNESKIKSETILIERGENFAILSYLESESRKLKIDKRIGYMKPVNFPETSGNLQLAGIEMNLVGINTKELVTFLHKIEASGKLLSVSRIKIQRPTKQGPQLLNVTLQVNTYNYTGKFPPKPKIAKPDGSKITTGAPAAKDDISPALNELLKKPNTVKNDSEFILFVYLSVLGQEPSAKHHTYWINKLRKGKPREDVILYFFRSDEYRFKNKTHPDFIVDVYRTVLSRIPDISEINAWVPRLQKGEKREDIINAFFQSDEYQKKAKKDTSWFAEWLKFLK